MKEIKDYLQFYLGCDVEVDQSEYNGTKKVWTYIGTTLTNDKNIAFIHVIKDGNHQSFYKTPVIPILRPLSDMTDEECDEFGIASDAGEYSYDSFEPDAVYGGWQAHIGISTVTERINEMRKRFLDCDGLIEAGLAIDKNTLP